MYTEHAQHYGSDIKLLRVLAETFLLFPHLNTFTFLRRTVSTQISKLNFEKVCLITLTFFFSYTQ